MLDWNRIRELRSEVGDDEFTLIVELFLDEVEGVIMRLSCKDRRRLVNDLHFLKDCAWTLGWQGLGDLCEAGEQLAITGAFRPPQLDEILDCYATSKQHMMGQIGREGGDVMRRA